MNFLEQLVAEWYQYKDYFVRHNIKVGRRSAGGYEGELDIVAFNPVIKHLIHIEPSSDTDSWEQRETRFKKKFNLGKEHIPKLFSGFDLPKQIEQQAIFLYGSKARETIGGGRVVLVADFLQQIFSDLKKKRIQKAIVPENLTLIRTLHVFIDNLGKIIKS